MADLSLWLDTYDDIYSDFDSRQYLRRRISEDFIEELRMSLKYRKEQPDALILSLPASQRHAELEKDIAISVREQLKDRLDVVVETARRVFMKGLQLLAGGLLLMGVSGFVALHNPSGYLAVVLRIAFEPAGWFMIWTGLDSLIYEYRKAKKEQSFYETLAQMKIHFKDI